MFSTNQGVVATNEPRNKRAGTKSFDCYEQASIYKQLQLDGGKFSKVKIKKRNRGGYDVLSYVPIGVS
jgi:hypothetical protein